MIDKEKILKHVKNNLKEIFDTTNLELIVDIHDEFSENPNADVDITLKALTGNIVNGVIKYPVQIIAEIKNQYFDIINSCLMNFCINNAETLFDYEGQKIEQLYTTPVVISTFNDNGIDWSTTVTIDATFIIYENAVFSDDIEIMINNTKLEGVFDVVYSNSHSCDSTVKLGSPMVENYTNGIQVSISINLDFKKSDNLHKQLIQDSESIVKYDLYFANGIISKTYKMELAGLTLQSSRGDIMRGQVVFRTTRGD